MTKTLRVDLADLEGIPHASGQSGTSVVVTAEYTSPVILESDGTIILSPKSKTMGASGRVDFDGIYASDSEEVREDHRGFAVRVKVAIREPNGATRTWARTVKPLEHMASTVRLGQMPSAEGLPPQWATVDEVLGDFDARLDSLEDHPVDHAARHATGGPDPITPASIGAAPAGHAHSWAEVTGKPVNFPPTSHTHTPAEVGAYPATGSTYSGHIDSLSDPGTYRISSGSMNAGNGYPWTPDTVGYAIVHRRSSGFVTQEIISETGTVWRRNSAAGSTTEWRAWVPIAVDTGWRTHPLSNGWTGDLRFRWRNGIVTVSITGLDGTSATNTNIVSNFGGHPGFHAGAGTPVHGLGHMTSNSAAPEGSNIGTIGLLGGTTNNIMRASSTTGWRGGAASMTYVAASATLPATLPGTPA